MAKAGHTYNNPHADELTDSSRTIDDIRTVSGFRSCSSVFRIPNKYGVKLYQGHFSEPLGKRKPKEEQ